MKSKNSQGRWRACALGAINGLVYGVIILQVSWLYKDHVHRHQLEVAERINMTPALVTDNQVHWFMIPCWFLVLFTVASYLAHRYQFSRLRSVILLWQVIGVTSVTGWNLIQLTIAWLDIWFTGQAILYREITSPTNPQSGPISLALVVSINLIYAAVIKLSLAQYSKEKEQSAVIL